MTGHKKKLIAAGDIADVASLMSLLPVALLVSARHWSKACRTYARLASVFQIERMANMASLLSLLQGGGEAEEKYGYRQCLEMMFASRLQIVDQNLFSRAVPDIPVSGREHIDAALDAGRGVILWTTPSAFSDLIVKIGLARAGLSVVQLSRPEHGFSNSAFGISVLNRLRTRVEDRYLHGRVTIDSGKEKSAMLALNRIVRANGIVNITVGSKSKRPHELAFRHGTLMVASGPVRMAKITGAALIPVFGSMTDDMRYRVDVDPPIEVQGRSTDEAMQCYADLLGDYLRRYPYQCRGFGSFTPNDSSTAVEL